RTDRIGIDIPVYHLSLIRELWEGRVKKHRQRQKKEEERLSKSALAKVNEQWQYRIACRKLKRVEVETLQCYLERSALAQLNILPTINKDKEEENRKFIFELTGKKWMKLPEDLQYMTYLKEWHIRETRIPEIPAYIQAFVDLRVLDVPRNGLTKIPVEIGKLISLRELNVNYNKLSNIPPELGDCENLERLEMTANFKLEELPFELRNLKKLKHLDLSENQFASIPICVLRMDALKCLDMSNNRLKDLPEDMDRIEALETVFLHKNKIKHIPLSMSNITHLKMLVLSADELIIRLYDNPIHTDDEDETVTDERDREFMNTYLQSLEDRGDHVLISHTLLALTCHFYSNILYWQHCCLLVTVGVLQ
ncbi:putative leucine-rich repeat-containing protein 2, partial [Triplophysa rosa]